MSPRLAARRRLRLPALALALAALAVPASASAAGLDEAGYWKLADATQQRLDATWDERAEMYRPGGSGTDPAVNASLLLTHAVAAQRGHEGPARNDHRARLLAARLTRPRRPVRRARRRARRPAAPRARLGQLDGLAFGADQHLVYDAEVVDGLVAAWRARRALDLPASTVAAIEDRIGRTVAGRFWRYPAIRLNQINWYGLMYAASATVNGRDNLLRHDLALQIRRFMRGIHGHGAAAGNLGPPGWAAPAPPLPPSLYAYDPDTGRLAVTTRAYNTAVMAVNQGAFP